jgi:succinate dehydrogenase/fumarate reductase cytochrome b subunit
MGRIGAIVWDICLSFGRETSIAGLNNASKAKSQIRSWLWICVFVAFLYQSLNGLVVVIDDYYQYPALTSINLTHKAQVPFPAVTVCNLNRSAGFSIHEYVY